MKTALIFCFFVLLSFEIFSQRPDNIWYFGDYAGLNFSSGTPVVLTNSVMSCADNSSTICDCNGNLLFYTNGENSYGKNHLIMPNGSNLGGNVSAGQCALIVPQPFSNLYYIFTTGGFSGGTFRYAIVDMNQNSGNGDVISKGNILFTGTTEKIDAIYNPVDTSYWILTHKWNSNQYCSYKLNSNGLQLNPVISSIGSIHSGGNPTGYNATGQMSFSPDGSKVASAIYSDGKIEIFDFNVATGVLSNPISLTGFTNAWGVAFSPNNQYLYFTEWYNTKVYQFNLTSGNSSTILASKIIVGTATFPLPSQGYLIGYLQNAPDSKIYIAKTFQQYISSINSPNNSGLACNFVDNAINLGISNLSIAGLSRTVNKFYQIPDSSKHLLDTICKGANYTIHFSDLKRWYVDSLGLNFIKQDSIFTFNNLQDDTILYFQSIPSNCFTKMSSFHLIISSSNTLNLEIGGDTTICNQDTLFINLTNIGDNYLWQDGSTDSIYKIFKSGKYYVTVEKNGCSESDTINIITRMSPIQIPIQSGTICKGDISGFSVPSGFNYLWSNGNTSNTITIADSGLFYVDVWNQCDTIRDTIIVKTKECNCRIVIPNAFTPTEDAINDYFFPSVDCELDDYHLLIYNRWGQLMYETTNQYDKWDGKYKNNECSQGVYFFVLYYKNLRVSKDWLDIKGSVTLIR